MCHDHIVTNTGFLIPTREAARRLRVTPSGISRMVKRGDLTPAHKMPGTRGAFLFDEQVVAEKEKATPAK